jgi:hypothetical protein
VLVASHPYWTDYVSAFGAGVGIVVAAAAFVVAFRSARDAHSSAESAERTARASTATLEAANEQLTLARQEHERLEAERMRRPQVPAIELSAIEPRPGEETPPGMSRIGFTNSGDRELREAVLTIMFDRGSAVVLTDRWGNPASDQSKDDTRERWPGVDGVPLAFDYFARHVSVPVGVSRLQYVCMPRAGRFPIRVKLFHAALDGDGPWADRWIDVDDQGSTTIIDIAEDGPAGRYEGRQADFDSPDTP